MAYQEALMAIPSKHKIRVEGLFNGQTHVISSVLPNDFGFTVGSNFSTPFDVGSVNETLTKIAATTGSGTNRTLQMRKVFIAPEPSEISFEMTFDAVYSALEEVVIPIITLLKVGLSRYYSVDVIDSKFNSALSKVSETANQTINTDITEDYDYSTSDTVGDTITSTADGVLEFVGFIAAPHKVTIRYGDLYTMRDCYINNISVKFSNKLDIHGMPMSATASVSVVLERPPTADNFMDMFSGI